MLSAALILFVRGQIATENSVYAHCHLVHVAISCYLMDQGGETLTTGRSKAFKGVNDSSCGRVTGLLTGNRVSTLFQEQRHTSLHQGYKQQPLRSHLVVPARASRYRRNTRTMQFDAIEVQAYNAANPADAAKVVQKAVREPGQGEVLVQMKYAGVRPCCCAAGEVCNACILAVAAA